MKEIILPLNNPQFKGMEISKNLKVGDLVTFKGSKAIKWFKNQKLMGVYDGNYGLVVKGTMGVDIDDYKKYKKYEKLKVD